MYGSQVFIRFGETGDHRLWPGEGWDDSPGESEYTWANAHVAKIRMMLEYTSNDRMLEIDIIPLKNRDLPQDLFVYLNGAFVAFWSTAVAGVQRVRIEAAFFNAGANTFAFVAPKALCPKEVGLGDDQRLLSFAYRWLKLSDCEDRI
jgi:hypothetical protein